MVLAWYPVRVDGLGVLGRRLPFAYLPERPYGKELVAAGDAAVGRKAQNAAEKRRLTRDMPGRDTLQLQIAATSAMRIQQIPKRSAAPAESRFTRLATPRQNAAEAKQIVHDCSAMGSPEFRAAACWTNELRRQDCRSP